MVEPTELQRLLATLTTNSDLRSYYEGLGSGGGRSAHAVGYRSERSWRGIRRGLELLLDPGVAGLHVLDVGCGHGRMTQPWTRRNRVVGVDAALTLLRAARDGGAGAVEADARALPFADGSFDVVLAIEVMQLLPDAPELLRSLARAARPGGTVIVATANRWSIVRRAANAAIALRLVPRGLPGGVPLPLPRSAAEVLHAASGAGLVAEAMATTYYPFLLERRHPGARPSRHPLASNFLIRFRKAS